MLTRNQRGSSSGGEKRPPSREKRVQDAALEHRSSFTEASRFGEADLGMHGSGNGYGAH